MVDDVSYMGSKKENTIIHRSGYSDEIIDVLKKKKEDENLTDYKELIEDRYDIELTMRQLRYFYNRYVVPDKIIKSEITKKEVEEKREALNVIIEQMNLYEDQKRRLEEIFGLDIDELQADWNLALGENQNRADRLKVIVKVAGITRKEIMLASELLEQIKETKQELGLMHKEPERLEIKTDGGELTADDFEPDELKKLALAMAGFDDDEEVE